MSLVGREARACFDFRIRDQLRTCRCEMVVRDVHEGKPIRRFGINEFIVDCEGKADETGAYRCVLSSGDHRGHGRGFYVASHSAVYVLCKGPEFAPLVSGEIGARNLELTATDFTAHLKPIASAVVC